MWPKLLLETLLSLKVGIEALNLCRERLCLPIFFEVCLTEFVERNK